MASELRLCPLQGLRSPQIVARFQAHKRDSQASDLRFYGAPKGIRNLACGLQEGSANPAEYRIVAGQTTCVVPAGTA